MARVGRQRHGQEEKKRKENYISVSCCTLVDAVPFIAVHRFMQCRSCNKYLARRALYVRQ